MYVYNKNMNIKFLTACLFTLLLISCTDSENESENTITNNCEYPTKINFEEYWNGQTNLVMINSLTINDDCLKLNFTGAGCDETPWSVELIDSGEILDGNPKERNLRLYFDHVDMCLVHTTKEVTFDISQLQIDGNEVLLNIKIVPDNFFFYKQILYEY